MQIVNNPLQNQKRDKLKQMESLKLKENHFLSKNLIEKIENYWTRTYVIEEVDAGVLRKGVKLN